jgi:hypothetical protein
MSAQSTATCPACNGSTRRPCPPTSRQYRLATYRESDDTLACNNCGGQTMGLKATGVTRVDPATGLGCLHDYRGRQEGNCFHVYTCTKCGDRYDIDSGD